MTKDTQTRKPLVLKTERELLKEAWDRIEQFKRELAEAKRELANDANCLAALDWNRIMEGDRRALDPLHQPFFDTHYGLEQRLAEAEKILDWLEEHGRSDGGGNGFTYTVFVPVDCEHLGSAILTAIAQENK